MRSVDLLFYYFVLLFRIGIGMDASITPLRHSGLSLVQTTDFFYPLVEDPYMQVSRPSGWVEDTHFKINNRLRCSVVNPNKSNLDPDLGFFPHFGSGPRAMITILEKNVLLKIRTKS